MAHSHHEDDQYFVLNLIQDPIGALPDPVTIVLSRELFTTGRSWLIGQGAYPLHNLASYLPRFDRLDFFRR
jgi:hypothetical protein